MIPFKRMIKSNRGDAIFEILMTLMLLIFVILPISGFILDKFIITTNSNRLKASIDMTNVAVFNSIRADITSGGNIAFDNSKAITIYKDLLADNMLLNPDLTPKEDSIAEGQVVIQELNLYTSGFPLTDSHGVLITKPTIHSLIIVPVKPSLYRSEFMERTGKDYVELVIQKYTELPIDN